MEDIPKEIKEQLKEIKNGIDKPYLERKEKISIIENNVGDKKKKITQYRVSIPKKFSDLIRLNKDDFIAETELDKDKNEIIIKIRKK